MAAANPQRKTAMKRLMFDQEELQKEPVANVSAAPLDDNMFEWHCNFNHDDTIYHLILFFPENYPYKSPSAEFMPPGFMFVGGATKAGKKGTQICLSIFSDFADWHKEWAKEKSMGWSPGYTVQTVLMNMVAFICEHQPKANPHNQKLAKGFTCKDCGHCYKKPFPPLEDQTIEATKSETQNTPQIVDYMSKIKFQDKKPKSKDDLYGFGLIKSGPPHRPALTTPCEFVTAGSFFGMKKSIGTVQSIMKENLAFFLPMFINQTHGKEIKESFEDTMKEIGKILPKCSEKTSVEEMVIKTIPNLMSATVVEFSKGQQHTSDNHLSGYFSLHRLLLWAIKTYPKLQGMMDNHLKVFIEDPAKRTKKECPHIGEWLMLLAASSKYRWTDAANAYLYESWRRNVMWYVKDDAKLGMLDTSDTYRLEKTLAATAVSRKLLAFQVLFLDIAIPEGMSQADILKRYDSNYGFPTAAMVEEMKDACQRITNMKTYGDWFQVLKLDPPSDEEILRRLRKAVVFSIKTDGYHWSFPKGAGGWSEVMKKYPGGKGVPDIEGDEGAGASKEPKSGGSKGKGRGKKSKVQEPEQEEEMEVEDVPKGKGRGRGKRAADAPAVGRGRGAKRGKKK